MSHSRILIPFIAFLFPALLQAQVNINRYPQSALTIPVTGTIREDMTQKPMAGVQVSVWNDMLKEVISTVTTDAQGVYTTKAPALERYSIKTQKATYFDQEVICTVENGLIAADFVLAHKPAYIFDMTIFDKAQVHNPINTLRDCKIEIYNNTTHTQELALEKLAKSTFNFPFEEGNHYTLLVRKPGYLNRRIELFVNINGCILCVDGMGISEPDVVPLMSHSNELGYFLGAIDLDSIEIGKRFQLKNIYYDFDKWAIRPEAATTLDNLAIFLKDNPGITVELGSHTDARGADEYNLSLSDKRAQAAVDYLVSSQGIDNEMITAKGYGESQLVNRCDDGISCSESEQQMNRRTEIKITGLNGKDPLWDKTLKQIIEDPQLYRKVIEQEKRRTVGGGR